MRCSTSYELGHLGSKQNHVLLLCAVQSMKETGGLPCDGPIERRGGGAGRALWGWRARFVAVKGISVPQVPLAWHQFVQSLSVACISSGR